MEGQNAEAGTAADRSGSTVLHTGAPLQGVCRLQMLQHRTAGSSGDGGNEVATPSSMASGGSTPGKLKRAFLAAVNGKTSAAPTSSDAWDQIVNSSRRQHKRICYLLLATMVIIAAVGAGGIAAGAKAKTAHERSVAAAAAAKAAERAAQAAVSQQADSTVADARTEPSRSEYVVTLSVLTAEQQQQACSEWFGGEERASEYKKLFIVAYSQALNVQQSDMTVDNIQCGGSKVTMSSDTSGSRSLKQVTNPVEIITEFSLPLPADPADSTRITGTIMTRSGGILSAPLSGFFSARTLVTKAGQISGTNGTTLSSTASIAVQGFSAPKPETPSSNPADQNIRSGSAAADIIKAGGIAAEAIGAAPTTSSKAAAAAAASRGSAPGPIPLVVVGHDGTVTINAPDEVLMPESAAVNATQVQEFRDAAKKAGRAGRTKQGASTVEIQLPPGLAVQDPSSMPDNVIPVTQASFAATEPLPVLAPEGAAAQGSDETNTSTTGNSTAGSSSSSSASSSSPTPPAIEPTAEPAAPAAATAVVPSGQAVATPGAAAPVTETSGGTSTAVVAPSSTAAELQSKPTASAAAAANDTQAVTEDTGSNPATTTFFPEMGVEVPEATQTPEPTQNPTGSPTEAQLAAYNWTSVLLDSYDKTPACPFMPVRGNFMGDALGRLWSLSNGQACAFKAPNPAQLSADPSGTKGAPLLTWDSAADCGEAPGSANSVTDAGGHTWGLKNRVSCAFKSQPAGTQASDNHGSNGSPPKMDTVWEVAPICSAAPLKFTAVPDVFGRLWGAEGDGRSCAYKVRCSPTAVMAVDNTMTEQPHGGSALQL